MQHMIAILLLTIVSANTGQRTISMQIPEGWREVRLEEIARLKPDVSPQNELQRRVKDAPSMPILAMKRDTGYGMAASVQVFVTPLPNELRGASSLEAARVVAFASFAGYGEGKYETEPRELTVGGLRAAEWVMRYKLVENIGGTHAMVMRSIVIVDGAKWYLIGYSGPAAATAELQAFDEVVKSVAFSK
jgi:hypothetical protein